MTEDQEVLLEELRRRRAIQWSAKVFNTLMDQHKLDIIAEVINEDALIFGGKDLPLPEIFQKIVIKRPDAFWNALFPAHFVPLFGRDSSPFPIPISNLKP